MQITKIAWSDKRKNKVVNLCALEPDSRGSVEVFTIPFVMRSINDIRDVINSERREKKQPPYNGYILCVSFDMSSGRLYLPNMEDPFRVAEQPNTRAMLDNIKMIIEKSVGTLPLSPLIRGDPLQTIRLRQLNDFPFARSFVYKQMKSDDNGKFSEVMSLPVIEVDLSVMPHVAKQLSQFGENLNKKGAYISKLETDTVEFSIDDDVGSNKRRIFLHTQKTPFILINTSKDAKTSEADKELIISHHFKEYSAVLNIQDEGYENANVRAVKHIMYAGWSFKDLCLSMFLSPPINNFGDLISRGGIIYNAAKSLKKDGYLDPSRLPYYYTFQIGEGFPIRFKPQDPSKPYDVSRMPAIFQILHYDPSSQYVVIKTPLWIPEDLCRSVLKANGEIFCTQYDPSGKIMKSDISPKMIEKKSPKSINIIRQDLFTSGAKAPDGETLIPIVERSLAEMSFERKHISDYPQASEIIMNLCRRASSEMSGKEIKFDDLEVVVGPWQPTMGILGGYFDTRRIAQKKIPLPLEPIPGVKIYPPVILVDSATYPSVADRVSTIIHEYRHHINSQLWVESPQYDMPTGTKTQEDIKKFLAYLNSPDERLAHKAQFKYMFSLGMTKEAILRDSLGCKPNATNLPLARKYQEILDEAEKEFQREEWEDVMKISVENAINPESTGISQDFDSPDDPFDTEDFDKRY